MSFRMHSNAPAPSAIATTAVLAVAALALFALPGCGGPAPSSASPPVEHTLGALPTSDEPSPTATPESSPTPEPTAPPTTSAPPPPVVEPASLPIQTGVGPAGSWRYTGSAAVAVTFDDGPDPTYTPQILDLLKANGVKATFCLVGKQAKAYPALVKRIFDEGHTLCNHTWAHSLDIGKQSKEVILKDLQDTNNVIHAAVPGAPIKYFRAPGGYFTQVLVGMAGSLGMHSLYWSVDTRDWEFAKFGHGQSMVDHIISTVQSKTRRGAIILSHDYKKPDTIAAYKTLLPWLTSKVTLVPMPVG